MSHIRVIAILDYIGGGLNVFLGIILIVISCLGAGAMGVSGMSDLEKYASYLGAFGILIGGAVFVWGAMSIFTGVALTNLASWSRWFHVVIAIVNLLLIPVVIFLNPLWICATPLSIGISGYYLWALLGCNETISLFSGDFSSGAAERSGQDDGGFSF